MEPQEFADQYTDDADTEHILTNHLFDDMAQFCRDNGIPETEVSDDDMEQLAETFVSAGFDAIQDDAE